MNRKSYTPDLNCNPGERSVVAKISTASLDHDGDIMMPMGCVTTDFEKNPAVFFGHEYIPQFPKVFGGMPVGKCVSIRRTDSDITAKTVFAARPASHPEGAEWIPDTIFSLFQQGILSGFSVGYDEIETRKATKGDVERYGDGVKRILSKWKMKEYSVAPLPCNQDALVLAVSKGIISDVQCKSMFGVDVKAIAPPAAVVVPPAPAKIKRYVMVFEMESDALPAPRIDVKGMVRRELDRVSGKMYSL